jgi:hypothetical protein
VRCDFIVIEEDEQRLLAEAVIIVQREAAGEAETLVFQLPGRCQLPFLAELDLCNCGPSLRLSGLKPA